MPDLMGRDYLRYDGRNYMRNTHFMQFGYTNPNDTEGIMDPIATREQIILFVAGRGSVIGSSVSPLIGIAEDSQISKGMKRNMGFDAGAVLSGEQVLEKATLALVGTIADLAAGTPSKSEALDRREYFSMYKHQDASSIEAGCYA